MSVALPSPAAAASSEAVARLAGGVAHDFNNLLMAINGSAALLLEIEGLDPQALESARRIYAAGEQAVHLTGQLLMFGGGQKMRPQPIHLNERMEEMRPTLHRLAGEAIAVELQLEPGFPPILADEEMVEQVVVNLVSNARDAMPTGGRLVISAKAVIVAEGDAQVDAGRRPGRFVCLEVRDNGSGIAPEILPCIFEPFFTTKEVGKGTGLGLSVSLGIVRQHGGWLAVETAPGAGTAFTAFFPIAPPGSETMERRSAEPPSARGGETILFVEDDALVRGFAVAALKSFGYRVLQARSAAEALEVWKWHAGRIALLFTDLVMPGDLSGWELAEKLQAEKPGLKVIHTSGYSPDLMARAEEAKGKINYLAKPCSPRKLALAVRQALDSRSA